MKAASFSVGYSICFQSVLYCFMLTALARVPGCSSRLAERRALILLKLQYHPSLYVSEGITDKKLDKIKKNLEKHPLRADVYLITYARNGVDQLEIYDCGQLAQSYYRNNPPFIVGITQTYAEAIAIIEQLAQECYRSRGDCALREYLLC